MPKVKQVNDELIAQEETLISPIDASSKELKGTAMENLTLVSQPTIARPNPALKGVEQNLGNGMKIKYN